MEFTEFLKLIRQKMNTIITIVFVGVMLVVLVSLTSRIKYSVESRLLVIQNASATDAYTLSRSNEYLGSLFSQIVYSSSFYDKIKASKYNIDTNYFSGDYTQQLKQWNKTIKTRTEGDTGIINIEIFHPEVSEAKKIALAVNDNLINNNQEYQGGQSVRIMILDQPLASRYPVKPNLLVNTGIAVIGLLMLSLFYIYIFPETKYNVYLFGKQKKQKNNFLKNDTLSHYQKEMEAIRKELHKIENINENNIEKDNVSDNPVNLNGNIRNIVSR